MKNVRPVVWLQMATVLLSLAVVVLALPLVRAVAAHADRGIAIDDSTTEVTLPAHATYGVYLDDADNSGYSWSCLLRDAKGGEIRLLDSSWTVSSSDTETQDARFRTGSGHLTTSCSADSATMRFRPAPNDFAVVLGAAGFVVLGAVGAALLVLWSSRRRSS